MSAFSSTGRRAITRLRKNPRTRGRFRSPEREGWEGVRTCGTWCETCCVSYRTNRYLSRSYPWCSRDVVRFKRSEKRDGARDARDFCSSMPGVGAFSVSMFFHCFSVRKKLPPKSYLRMRPIVLLLRAFITLLPPRRVRVRPVEPVEVQPQPQLRELRKRADAKLTLDHSQHVRPRPAETRSPAPPPPPPEPARTPPTRPRSSPRTCPRTRGAAR